MQQKMKLTALHDAVSFWMHPEKSTAFHSLVNSIIHTKRTLDLEDDVFDLHLKLSEVADFLKYKHVNARQMLTTLLSLPDVQEYIGQESDDDDDDGLIPNTTTQLSPLFQTGMVVLGLSNLILGALVYGKCAC